MARPRSAAPARGSRQAAAPRQRAARVAAEAPPFDPFSALAAFLIRVQTLGLLLVAAGAVLVAAVLDGEPRLRPVGAPIARTLGLGAVLVAAALAGLGSARMVPP